MMVKKYVKQVILIMLVCICAYYISNNWYQLMLIQGNSMRPAYHDMQFVILDKHSKAYTYGDVVAFKSEGLNAVLVKRIAACPGDTAHIKDGTLYVNGAVSLIYSLENYFEYAGLLEKEIELMDDQYIVLGDNSCESKDSRYEIVGPIERRSIIGEVIR